MTFYFYSWKSEENGTSPLWAAFEWLATPLCATAGGDWLKLLRGETTAEGNAHRPSAGLAQFCQSNPFKMAYHSPYRAPPQVNAAPDQSFLWNIFQRWVFLGRVLVSLRSAVNTAVVCSAGRRRERERGREREVDARGFIHNSLFLSWLSCLHNYSCVKAELRWRTSRPSFTFSCGASWKYYCTVDGMSPADVHVTPLACGCHTADYWRYIVLEWSRRQSAAPICELPATATSLHTGVRGPPGVLEAFKKACIGYPSKSAFNVRLLSYR